eukprot:SAG31_NODE_17050_length_685_cov_1.126280_1_plen_169_part_01
MQPAFELLNDVYAREERAADRRWVNESQCPVVLWPNCSRCPCKQPLALSSRPPPAMAAAGEPGSRTTFRTLQLNTTFVSGRPSVLRYGWGDYPTLVLYDAEDGRPVPPFNVSIVRSAADKLLRRVAKSDDPEALIRFGPPGLVGSSSVVGTSPRTFGSPTLAPKLGGT